MLAALICVAAFAQENIKVAAAANLRNVFAELKAKFEKGNPDIKVDVTFGSSGNFVQQILSGASFDFFMAADTDFPLKLQEKGATSGEVKPYIKGKLALWSGTLDVEKLGLEALTSDAVKKIAIANPKTAPYGERAVELLKKQGLFDKLSSKIIYGDNISAAAQYAFTGNAELGFTALSLALAPDMKGKGHLYIVPQEYYTPIEQACVLIKKPAISPAAVKFMDFVLGGGNDDIWVKYGYSK